MDAHKPGPLKQVNKKHKTGKHKSKRNRNSLYLQEKNGMKLSQLNLKARRSSGSSKRNRRNTANQKRKIQWGNVVSDRRVFELSGMPQILTVISLSDRFEKDDVIETLTAYKPNVVVEQANNKYTYDVRMKKVKTKYQLVFPDSRSVCECLDAAKVSDCICFTCHADDDDSDLNIKMLDIVCQHCVPVATAMIKGLSSAGSGRRAYFQKMFADSHPDVEIHSVDELSSVWSLFQKLASRKSTCPPMRMLRSYILADTIQYDEGKRELIMTGYIRGHLMSPDHLFYIPGIATAQVELIEVLDDDRNVSHTCRPNEDTRTPAPCYEDQASNVVDAASETTTKLISYDDDEDNDDLFAKVPQGTSEYQAMWLSMIEPEDNMKEISNNDSGLILDSDVSSNSGDDNNDCALLNNDCPDENNDRPDENNDCPDENNDCPDENNDCPDENNDCLDENTGCPDENNDCTDENNDCQMDHDETKHVRFEQPDVDMDDSDAENGYDDYLKYPDEMDTPVNAKEAFREYRGLASFNKTPWVDDYLPPQYSRIHEFERFRCGIMYVRKKEFKRSTGLHAGLHIRIIFKDIPKINMHAAGSRLNMAFSLLPHEEKMSVCNFVLNRSLCSAARLEHNQNLVFFAGIRRFTAGSLFSEDSHNDKFKCEKYFSPGTTLVASVYAPLTVAPCPVLVFNKYIDGSLRLVASGHLQDANPGRTILERVVLTGHPYKITGNSSVIRYMFSNPDEINYFKSVPLASKYGRKGEIEDSIGTHGYMRCRFNKPLKSQDVVMMFLYKRVFPKWDYSEMNEVLE